MKIVSWNVNGIRAASRKGFLKWMKESAPDVICLQETKARPEQLDSELTHAEGYKSFWHSAEKAGYSGVAFYSRHEPLDVKTGVGDLAFDREGRVLTLEFEDFSLINAYFPNSQRDHARLNYKLDFCQAMLENLESARARKRNIILCGDFNIAHREIDLRNPKSNENNAGFLPEERAWMSKLIEEFGYVDAFREFEKGPGHYTWWSYRPGVREKNIGWRLDYFVSNPEFRKAISNSRHWPEVMGSDHCPIELRINSKGLKGC